MQSPTDVKVFQQLSIILDAINNPDEGDTNSTVPPLTSNQTAVFRQQVMDSLQTVVDSVPLIPVYVDMLSYQGVLLTSSSDLTSDLVGGVFDFIGKLLGNSDSNNDTNTTTTNPITPFGATVC